MAGDWLAAADVQVSTEHGPPARVIVTADVPPPEGIGPRAAIARRVACRAFATYGGTSAGLTLPIHVFLAVRVPYSPTTYGLEPVFRIAIAACP